jgi:6-phosphogluconolactonase
MPNLYKFNIGNDFVSKAASAIRDFIEGQEKETVRIALSGGSSPKAIYEKLAANEKIDWSRVEIFIVDERADHSNETMIKETLVSKLPNLKKFHPLTDGTEAELKKLSRPFFDLVLLGLGRDGHTASIFPHSEAITELEKLVLHTESPAGVKERITLSFPALLSTEKIIFLIRGTDKKEIVKKWLSEEGDEQEIPARVALEHDDVDIYYGMVP